MEICNLRMLSNFLQRNVLDVTAELMVGYPWVKVINLWLMLKAALFNRYFWGQIPKL